MSSLFNYGTTSMGSGLPTTISSSVWRQLAASKELREEFSALQVKRGVSFQIRALLNRRGWTQARLAEESKLTQGVISRAQDPAYGNLTINTINRIANGFDVAFIGQFVPFGELVEWFETLSEEIGELEPFEKEYSQFLKRRGTVSRWHVLRKKPNRNPSMKKKRAIVRMRQEGQMVMPFDPIQAGNVIRFSNKTGESSSIPNLPLSRAAGAGVGAYYGNQYRE